MSINQMFTGFDPTAQIGTATEIYKNRRYIEEKFVKISRFIRSGLFNMIILGPSGVGKSHLGRLLANGLKRSNFTDIKDSVEIERNKLEGKVYGRAIVFPGQKRRRDANWGEFQNIISRGGFNVVIFCVAYGLRTVRHSAISEYGDSSDHLSSDNINKFVEKFRDEEIEILKNEVVPHLKHTKKRLVFITCIMKQDLWWDIRNTVRDHYERGPYATVISELESYIGRGKFVHIMSGLSCRFENIVDANNKILKYTTGGYDDTIAEKSMVQFLSNIEQLKDVSKI